MQTQLNILNMSPTGSLAVASKGHIQSSGPNQGKQSSEQFTGFMEIMGAMLNFGAPPVDDASSCCNSETSGLMGDEGAEIEVAFNTDRPDRDAEELIQMLWHLSNLIDQQKMNLAEDTTPQRLDDFIQNLLSTQPEIVDMLKSQDMDGWKENFSEIIRNLQLFHHQSQTGAPVDIPPVEGYGQNPAVDIPGSNADVSENDLTAITAAAQGAKAKDVSGNALEKAQPQALQPSDLPEDVIEKETFDMPVDEKVLTEPTVQKYVNEAALKRAPKTGVGQFASASDSERKTDRSDLKTVSFESTDGSEKNGTTRPAKEMVGKFQPFKVTDISSQAHQAAFEQKPRPISSEIGNAVKETQPAMSGEQKNTIEPAQHLNLNDGLLNDGDESLEYADQKNTANILSPHSSDNRTVSKGELLSQELSATREAHLLSKENQSDIIRQIVQRMTLNSQGSQSKMHIRLKPDFLGDVHLQVLTENQQVSIRMTADSHAVKEIVEQNMHHLKQELQQHGLEIQKFDVFVNNDNLEGKSSQEQAAFGQAQRQRQQRTAKRGENRKENSRLSAVENKKQNIQKDSSAISYFV